MKLNFAKSILDKKYFIDSRLVEENSIFVCIKGPNNDGHKFIKFILKKFKKTIIICEKKSIYSKFYKKNNRILFCNSTLKFISDLAEIKRSLFNNNIFIGITGSSGKTTLKEILYEVLRKYKPTYKSQKSYNNKIGLPYTLINQTKNTKFNIYELGMNKLGEINNLSKLLKPNIGIITNIGEAHLGKLGSLNNIAKAKSEIIKNITNGGLIILNNDCKYINKLKQVSKKNNLKILTFGNNPKSSISYKIINDNFMKVKLKDFVYKIKIRNLNQNNINNILVCILIINYFKLNLKLAIKIFSNLKHTKGRGNKIKLKNKILVIDESYNSNPTSLKNSINQFSNFKTKKKKILVIGEMLELGRFSKRKHSDIGKYMKSMKFDRIYLIGKETKNIYKQIYSTFWCKYFENANTFSKDLKNVLMENSVIMFKASNGVGLNKLLNKKIY